MKVKLWVKPVNVRPPSVGVEGVLVGAVPVGKKVGVVVVPLPNGAVTVVVVVDEAVDVTVRLPPPGVAVVLTELLVLVVTIGLLVDVVTVAELLVDTDPPLIEVLE